MAELGVVTGSSRGIGRAIALALAARGLDLALLSRTSEAQSETVRACRAAGVSERTRGAPDGDSGVASVTFLSCG